MLNLIFVPILFISLFFPTFAMSSEAQGAIKIAGYRVIRASPVDFKNALWASESKDKGLGKDYSRLTRLLRIKNKNVHQDTVSFQVMSEGPAFQENQYLNQLTEFTITEKKISETKYRLDVVIKLPLQNYVNGHIDVEPHELGSLLTFYVEKSAFSDVTVDVLIKSFQLIKVMSADQQTATMHTLTESK